MHDVCISDANKANLLIYSVGNPWWFSLFICLGQVF